MKKNSFIKLDQGSEKVMSKKESKNAQLWEFPGGLVVKTQCFHRSIPDPIPGLGVEIPL